jgi:hypothetical protein
MFCLITDLLDCEVYPARVLAAACRWRWDGSETGLRETKSLLDGAGADELADCASSVPADETTGG